MLAKRIATALTLAPLVVLGVLYLSPSWFSLVIGIMTCIASWEYCKLIKLSGFSNRAFYITVLLACAFLLAISPLILKTTLYLVTIWWLAALFVVVGFPNRTHYLRSSISYLIILSVLFTLTIILSFYFTVLNSIKQKNISEMKTDFINNMTHEFKTPIATIDSVSYTHQTLPTNREV